jgi:glycosyltransferase involved in cell wall biosynthesis
MDIIETYGIDSDNVTAIPLAAAPHFQPIRNDEELQRVRQTYGIEGEYILSVGAIQPRKNLSRLVTAYSRLRRATPKGNLPKLVLAGKCAWLYEETLRTIKELQLSDSVILTGYVPESDLPVLYSGALCFVYPSYFEGFGLPPLEAMKCGVPVIVGNRTSLPEVVGDAGILVDPFDPDAIAGAMDKLISDSNLRAELTARGLARAQLFDWRETARQTLMVYQRAASVAQ